MNVKSNVILNEDPKEELEARFYAFTTLANDLSNAYQELENKVSVLTNRLEHVTEERFIELTEKERLAHRLEKLLKMLPTAVIVIDGQGIVKECNPEAKRLLNHTLLEFPWRTIIQEVFSPKEDDGCEVSLIDGKRVSLSIQPLDEEPGQIVVMNDLTQTRSLQAQAAKDKHLKEMGKMLASLAHQIRTPLATAILYLSHLKDQGIQSSKRDDFVDKINSRLQNIEQQVKDMLICAKGGSLTLKEHLVSELLDELELISVEKMREAGGQLIIKDMAGPTIIRCHRESLLGALQNLINNAIEACTKSPLIKVMAKRVDENICLCVVDNGPGIDKSIIDKVTNPFFTTRTDGTGLGLDIVKGVIDEHHGKMKIKVNEEQGTTIQLTLPTLRGEKNG